MGARTGRRGRVGLTLLALLLLAASGVAVASTPPSVVVDVANDSTRPEGAGTIDGRASDDGGVVTVDVAVQDRGSGGWLQPDGSFGAYRMLPAVVADVGATTTTWQVTITLPPGDYGVLAVAEDDEGARTPRGQRSWRRFRVVADPDPPAVDPPGVEPALTDGTELEVGAVVLEGLATSDVEVVGVDLAVRDRATGTWLRDDGTWGGYQRLPAELSSAPGGVGWRLAPDLPVGDYGFHAVASDEHGQQTPPGARRWRTFRVVPARPAGPVATIDVEDGSTHPSDEVPLRGTATAVAGVELVRLHLQDTSTGAWLHADGRTGDRRGIVAELSHPGQTSTAWSVDHPVPAGTWSVEIEVRDVNNLFGAADEQPTPTFTTYEVPPPPGPTVTLAIGDGAVLEAGTTVLDGDASSDEPGGVAAVEVAVRDRLAQGWLTADGSTQPERTSISAVLGDPGAPATTWTADLPLPPGQWSVEVRGRDGEGTPTAPDRVASADVDVVPAGGPASARPTTTIDQAAVDADRVLTLAGGAADDGTVADVRVAVVREDGSAWARPDGTAGAFAWLVAEPTTPGAAPTSWRLTQQLPVGRWRATVVAFDDDDLATDLDVAATTVVEAAVDVGFLTIQVGRSAWGLAHGCVLDERAFTLGDLAAFLSEHGHVGQGTTAMGQMAQDDPSARFCPWGTQMTASWDDLALLRDTYGFTFVGDSQALLDADGRVVDRRPRIATLDPAEQHRQSCGSLDVLASHGHHRGWGLFAYAGNLVDDAVQRDLVSTCYAFGRVYASGLNHADEVREPWFVSADSAQGGHCNDPAADCHDFDRFGAWSTDGWNHNDRRYEHPAVLLERASAAPGTWSIVQFYRLVEDRRLPGPDEVDDDHYWDCTAADPALHWTSKGEIYCAADLRWVVEQLPDHVVTVDAATVAGAWGRGEPGA